MLERPRSMEMRTPAVLSAGVHVFAMVAAIVQFNFFSKPPIEPEPVMVEFEAIAKHAAAPKVGVQEQQPEKAKIAEETTKAPPPKTAEPPPAPEQPKKEVAEAAPQPPKVEEKKVEEKPKPAEDKIALKPKEPEPPKVEKPEPKPEPKPEVKKPEPKPPVAPAPKPEVKKPETVDNIVDSILKNNDKTPPIKTPQQSPQKPKEITRQAAMAPNLASVVTASEIEGVRAKVRACWHTIGGAKAGADLTVQLVVQMNQDGTPTDAEIKDMGRYNRDPLFASMADAARRAVLNPKCHPWPLPADKYSNGWRYIVFNFDPRDY